MHFSQCLVHCSLVGALASSALQLQSIHVAEIGTPADRSACHHL
jgi:hypothetical protein